MTIVSFMIGMLIGALLFGLLIVLIMAVIVREGRAIRRVKLAPRETPRAPDWREWESELSMGGFFDE